MAILQIKPEKKQEPAWIRYIRNRILKKKNMMPFVSGPTGSGKSWSCLSIALMLDKNFGIDRVVFGLRGLMELINSEQKFPRGSVFVWDEFQIDAGNRSWQSLTNKLLNSLLSTFRHKQFVLIINAPYSDFIDSHSKKLLHAEWEVVGIDYDKNQSILKPMLIQYNSRRKQFYHKYLRVKAKNGVAPVTRWRIPKPPKWIIDEYELRKQQFTTQLNLDIEERLDEMDNKKKKKPLTDKQAEVIDLMNKYDDVGLVAKEIGITERNVYFHLFQARKKGYEPIKTAEKEAKQKNHM